MYIGLDNIRELFPAVKSTLRETDSHDCLTGWHLLESAPVPYNTHILYVCTHKADIDFIPGMHVLCLVDDLSKAESLSGEFPPELNLLLLEYESPQTVYAALTEYFDTQCGIGLFSETLLGILTSEGGVQALVDHAHMALGNPIFVFDAGYSLVAATWEEARKLNTGIDMLENSGFTSKTFEFVNTQRNKIHKQMLKSEEPIQMYNADMGYDQLLCAIDTQKDLGHIVVSASSAPLKPMDFPLLKILKFCIGQQLKKDEFIRNIKGFNYEFFLKDLLDGKLALGKQYLNRMDYIGNEFSGNLYCLVVETARSSSALNTNHIRSLFEMRFPKAKTLVYNGKIICILNTPEKQLITQEALEDAASICRENGLFAGMSNCFQSITDISEYYQQAQRAIELGLCDSDAPGLFIYEDYYLEHMRNIFVQKESARIFCHPKMKFLLEYDRKNDSELAYTLYMYLIHERNISTAAGAMHMHRNSLVYRINRITALIGEDKFDNYRERQYLILSYEVNKDSI